MSFNNEYHTLSKRATMTGEPALYEQTMFAKSQFKLDVVKFLRVTDINYISHRVTIQYEDDISDDVNHVFTITDEYGQSRSETEPSTFVSVFGLTGSQMTAFVSLNVNGIMVYSDPFPFQIVRETDLIIEYNDIATLSSLGFNFRFADGFELLTHDISEVQWLVIETGARGEDLSPRSTLPFALTISDLPLGNGTIFSLFFIIHFGSGRQLNQQTVVGGPTLTAQIPVSPTLTFDYNNGLEMTFSWSMMPSDYTVQETILQLLNTTGTWDDVAIDYANTGIFVYSVASYSEYRFRITQMFTNYTTFVTLPITEKPSLPPPILLYDFRDDTLNLQERKTNDPEIAAQSTSSLTHVGGSGIDLNNSGTIQALQTTTFETFPTSEFSVQYDLFVSSGLLSVGGRSAKLALYMGFLYKYPLRSFAQAYNTSDENGILWRLYAHNTAGNLAYSQEGQRRISTLHSYTTHGLPILERNGNHTVTLICGETFIDDAGFAKRRVQIIFDDELQETITFDPTYVFQYSGDENLFDIRVNRNSANTDSVYYLQQLRFYDRVLTTEERYPSFIPETNYQICYTNLHNNSFQIAGGTSSAQSLLFDVDGYTYPTNAQFPYDLTTNNIFHQFDMLTQDGITTMYHIYNFVTARSSNTVNYTDASFIGIFWGVSGNREYTLKIGDYTQKLGSITNAEVLTTWAIYLTLDYCKFYHDGFLKQTINRTDHPVFWNEIDYSLGGQGFINTVLTGSGRTEIFHIMKMATDDLQIKETLQVPFAPILSFDSNNALELTFSWSMIPSDYTVQETRLQLLNTAGGWDDVAIDYSNSYSFLYTVTSYGGHSFRLTQILTDYSTFITSPITVNVVEPNVVMKYDFTRRNSDGSIKESTDELITGEAELAMIGNNNPLGFITHPNDSSKQALYLDRTNTDEFTYSSLVCIPNGVIAQMPTANFSIQTRYYFLADGVGDDYDMRLKINYYSATLGGGVSANSNFYVWFNGKNDRFQSVIVMDGVQSVLYNDDTRPISSWDLHTTGNKCVTLSFDTANGFIYIYNNGILLWEHSLPGDFAMGIMGSQMSALYINEMSVSNDPEPGGKTYLESIKVFNRVLSTIEDLT
jgi:hypothetical protein